MIPIKHIRDNKAEVIERLNIRGDYNKQIEDIYQLDITIRNDNNRIEELQKQLNINNKLIRDIINNKGMDNDETKELITENKNINKEIQKLAIKLTFNEETLYDLLLNVPNIPNLTVPKGDVNELIYQTEIPNKTVKPHWDVLEGIVDFKLGTKLTGTGFPVYKGKGEILRKALIDFTLDEAEKAGFEQIGVPLMVNIDTVTATGQYPDKEGQMYKTENMFMIPTAEVPLTNIYRNEILNTDDLPIKICGYTPCFRREAGAYGKDVRGLNRVHQFDKVEMVRIEHPDNAYDALEEMVEFTKNIIEKLELPFRIVKLCGDDLGFTGCMAYDLETYAIGQEKWLEVATITNFEDFQANRLKLRIKDGKNKILAHTLNGTGLAVPRIMATILENNQTEDGILIPKVLHKYTKFDKI